MPGTTLDRNAGGRIEPAPPGGRTAVPRRAGQRGASVIEFAALLALIACGCLLALTSLGSSAGGVLSQTGTALNGSGAGGGTTTTTAPGATSTVTTTPTTVVSTVTSAPAPTSSGGTGGTGNNGQGQGQGNGGVGNGNGNGNK